MTLMDSRRRLRPCSYEEWKNFQDCSNEIPTKFDMLRLPGRGVCISLTKLLGTQFGKLTKTSPEISQSRNRSAEKKSPVNPLSRLSWSESKNSNRFLSDVASPMQFSPSESSRLYVAGALHRLIETGEIPLNLSPVARNIYASESPKGTKTLAMFNPSDRFEQHLISPRSPSMFSETKNSKESTKPLRTISRPQSASNVRSRANMASPCSPEFASPAISQGKYRATISSPNEARVELRAESACRQQSPEDAPTLRGSAASLSTHEALRFSFLACVLPADCLLLLAQNSHIITCAAGHILAMQGRRCDAAHVVVDGQLALHETRPGSAGPARVEVARIDGLGDCVSEAEVLVGAAAPHTIQCATPCRLVRIPIRAVQAAIRHAPHAAHLLAGYLAQRRSDKALDDLNRRPASLLVKVLGLSGGPRAGQAGAEAAAAPAMLEVGVVGGASGREVGGRRSRQGEGAVLLRNPQLSVDRLFEVTVAERDARIYVRLTLQASPHDGGGDGGGGPGGGVGGDGGTGGGGGGVPRGPVWEAKLALADVLRTRTLSADLPLAAAGPGGNRARAPPPAAAVSVMCSARGMYSADEWGLLEWLGDGAADLPMLLRCGVRSLRDLEALGLSDLLAAMEAGGLAAPVRARLAGRFHAAKAAGPGFLGAYGKALAARILRFYRRPGAVSAPPGLSCSGAWRGPLEPRWAGHLFAGCADELGGVDRSLQGGPGAVEAAGRYHAGGQGMESADPR